jgi:glycopeptide antibiotics resistance protein
MRKSAKYEQITVSAMDWSNRILILGIGGILFLTLFPFGFVFHANPLGSTSPFLLQSGMKSVGAFDDFLNILLFIPFGFGLTEYVRKKGISRQTSLILALVTGAALSYGIEFLQNFLPSRDAGWHDVLTNTAGSIIGFAIFELVGKATLRVLSAVESALGRLLTPHRAAWVVSLYFVVWIGVSAQLQRQTQPNNWDPNCPLVVGNTAGGRQASAWKGEIDRLEFWDRPLPDDLARLLTGGDRTMMDSTDSLAAYEFSAAAPFRDRRSYLPDLNWKSNPPPALNPGAIVLDGKSWLVSTSPVTPLIKNIQASRQFAIQVICTPALGEGMDGRIVTVSRASGVMDLDFRQDDANLVFWFRSPISVSHSILAWYIPNVFVPGQKRDILISYDGANLSAYINGQRKNGEYELGPGTSLARLIRRVKPSELIAYKYVYYAFLFFTGGILLGITCRKLNLTSVITYLPLAAAILIPPVLLEFILVHVSGRARSIGDIVIGFCLALGGSLWINAD